MSRFAHVVKKAGFLINDGYLTKLVANHRQYVGVAAAHEGKITVAKFAVAPTVDALKAAQDSFKDSTALICCGDIKVLDEDVQPIVVLKDSDGEALCVVALDGDFDRHKKANESHVPEYLVARNIIEKKIARWCDGDISKLKEALDDELNKGDIVNLWGERGAVTFLLATGETVTITSGNEHKGEYSWGFASNAYGFMEQVTAPPKEAEKPKTLAEQMKASLGGFLDKKPKTEIATAAPQNGTAVSTATVPEAGDTTAAPPIKGKLWKLNQDLYNTKAKRRDFITSKLGFKPQNFNNPSLVFVEYPDGKWELADTKTLQVLGGKVNIYPPTGGEPELPKEQQETQTKAEPVADPLAKKTKTPIGGEPPKEVGGPQSKTALSKTGEEIAAKALPAQVSTARLPVISPSQAGKVEAILKKETYIEVMGENYKPVIDPKDLRKQIETTIPNFAARFKMGNSMEVFDGWSYEQIYALILDLMRNGDPTPIAKLFYDERNYAIASKLGNPNVAHTTNSTSRTGKLAI